jgi:hypothetical protein
MRILERLKSKLYNEEVKNITTLIENANHNSMILFVEFI